MFPAVLMMFLAVSTATMDVPRMLLDIPTTVNGNLSMLSPGMELLASIKGPVAIVGMVGPYRSGKSFLLNQLKQVSLQQQDETSEAVSISSQGDAFMVGDTVWPATAGLAIQVLGQTPEGVTVCLLDTPGLSAPIHDYKWDSRVVSFTLLASSLLMYNSFRTVDHGAIHTLAGIGELAEVYAGITSGQILQRDKDIESCLNARAASGNMIYGRQSADAGLFVPKLMWVIRDSELKLVDRFGTPITATQWLYTAMLDIHRSSKETRDKDDALRVCTMFSGIEATGLPNPFYNVKNTRGEIVKSKHLSGLFKSDVKKLHDAIMSSAVPKSVGGGPLNGMQMVALMQAWIRAINRAAAFPNTDSDTLLQLVNQEAVQVAVRSFDARSSDILALIPTSPDRLLAEVGRDRLGCCGNVEWLESKQMERLATVVERDFKHNAFGNGTVIERYFREVHTEIVTKRKHILNANRKQVLDILRTGMDQWSKELDNCFASVGALPVESKLLQEAGRLAKSAVPKLVSKQRESFGVLVDEVEVMLDKYVSDREVQWNFDNAAASKRECTERLHSIAGRVNAAILSTATLERTLAGAKSRVERELRTADDSCRGPDRGEYEQRRARIEVDIDGQLREVFATRRKNSLFVLSSELAGAVVLGALWLKCRCEPHLATVLRTLVSCMGMVIAFSAAFFEWRNDDVTLAWLLSIPTTIVAVVAFVWNTLHIILLAAVTITIIIGVLWLKGYLFTKQATADQSRSK